MVLTKIATTAPGDGADRNRLCHVEQKAVPFCYWRGEWWADGLGQQRLQPTLGLAKQCPSLKYWDTASLYMPAENDRRSAPLHFQRWSVMPQLRKRLKDNYMPFFDGTVLQPSTKYWATLGGSWEKWQNYTPEQITNLALGLTDPSQDRANFVDLLRQAHRGSKAASKVKTEGDGGVTLPHPNRKNWNATQSRSAGTKSDREVSSSMGFQFGHMQGSHQQSFSSAAQPSQAKSASHVVVSQLLA